MIIDNIFYKKIEAYNDSYYENLLAVSSQQANLRILQWDNLIDKKTAIPTNLWKSLTSRTKKILDLYTTTLVPVAKVINRIIMERPEVFYKTYFSYNGKINYPFSYEDLYHTLMKIPYDSAEMLLMKLSSNIAIQSKLISSFRKSDINSFCNILYDSKEDYTSQCYSILGVECEYKLAKIITYYFYTYVENKYKSEIEELSYKTYLFTIHLDHYIQALFKKSKDDGDNAKRMLLKIILENEDEFVQDISSMIEEGNNEDYIVKNIQNAILLFGIMIMSKYSEIHGELTDRELVIINNLFRGSTQQAIIKLLLEFTTNKEIDIEEVFLPDDFFNNEHRTKSNDSIGFINDRIKDKGVKAYCKLINYLACEKYIDDSIEVRKNFAFKFSGYYVENDKGILEWKKDTNILSVLIQRICDSNNKWDRAKVMIKAKDKIYNSSILRKKNPEDRDFAIFFYQLYNIKLTDYDWYN